MYKRVPTRNLMPSESLAKALCHESGRILHAAATRLTAAHIETMHRLGIERVFEVDAVSDVASLKQDMSARNAWVVDLPVGVPLPTAIRNAAGTILLPQGAVLTAQSQATLMQRGIEEVYWDQSPAERAAPQADEYLREVSGDQLVADFVEEGKKIAPEIFAAKRPAPSPADRRQHRRIPANIQTQFHVQKRQTSAWEEPSVRGTLKDISKGGLCLVTLRELKSGDRVRVVLAPRSRTVEIEGIAEVIRVTARDGAFEIGGKFLYIGAKRKG
ncbi:MAG: PilZ domain-containing protein [Planctomycetota bacterium]